MEEVVVICTINIQMKVFEFDVSIKTLQAFRCRCESSSNAAALIARWRRQLQKENPFTPLTSPVPEQGDLSVTHQLAKLRHRIVETLTSVRPFRSELD
ncbi:hypothetical protein YC2023_032541 [Brassica napus]